jgi:hypothetical protein
MHWFDRVAKRAAEAEGRGLSTRRGLLKGVVGATAMAPLVAGLPASAATPRPRDVSGRTECEECLAKAFDSSFKKMDDCFKYSKPAKGAKKASPAGVARRVACQAKARKRQGEQLAGCAVARCEGEGTRPEVPTGGGATAHQQCPEGTARCTDQMCCAIGDNCCPCGSGPEGMICCAGVIGCTCC